MTRNEAVFLGLKKYFTGAICKHGHIAYRYTNTGACIVCTKTYQKDYKKSFRLREKFRFIAITGKKCHPDDLQKIHSFIDALNAARLFV